MSDHRFLKFQCQISNDKRGPGYWKLNVSYLQNDKYVNGIQNIINNLDKSLTPIDKWERIKLKVKEFSVNFSIFQQKIIKTRTKIIEQEIKKMESGRTEDFDYRKLKELEAELDDIHDKRT